MIVSIKRGEKVIGDGELITPTHLLVVQTMREQTDQLDLIQLQVGGAGVTGVLQDPKLVVYMQHWHPPDPALKDVPGEWRKEDKWPPAGVQRNTLFFGSDHMLETSSPARTVHQLK